MCDIIWCKKEKDGKPCDTVNYLDPYCFWNWEGKVGCAGCGAVYYIHMINGHMYSGPDEKAGEQPDIRPLYADKPLDGYTPIPTGTEGKTRPFRGWRPQPPSAGVAGSFGFFWDIEKLSPEVWAEYKEKLAKGEVKDW